MVRKRLRKQLFSEENIDIYHDTKYIIVVKYP